MLHIFEVLPRENRTPTRGLQISADRLLQVAADAESQRPKIEQTKSKYFSTLGIAARSFPVSRFQEAIKIKLRSLFGYKGPVDSALNELEYWSEPAQAAGYFLESPQVQEAFAYFLMSVQTDSFHGQDTNGTQMGNFQGVWHGGGFKN